MELIMYKQQHLAYVLDIYVRAFTAPPLNYDFITHEKAERYINSITMSPGFLGYTYWQESQMYAFVFGELDDYFDGSLFHIKEFAVSPDSQGMGIGSKAMALLESKLAGYGVKAINLHTSRRLPAYEFYTKNGYAEVEENVCLMKWLQK